jgi:hypothetical protein
MDWGDLPAVGRSRRRLRLATVAIVVLLGAAFSPAELPAVAATSARDVVRIVDNTAGCRAPNVAVRVPALDAISCFHGGDPAPAPFNFGTPQPPPGKDPLCYGGGVTGNRVQAVYVTVAGKPDRAGENIPAIKLFYIPHVEASVRNASNAGGAEFGVRWHMPDCKISVDVVTIPAEAAAPEPDVFTQIWLDAPSAADNRPGGAPGVCGIASGIAYDTDTYWGAGDTPVVNVHDGILSMYAITFRSPGPHLGMFNCWGTGSTGAGTELHELFHTLGAVQMTAPNTNKHSHCTDGPDVMCYPEFGWPVYERCQGALNLLDCNSDDYFNVNPAPGSYLSTHWNTARSSFLGSSQLDQVPAAVRRP